MTFLKRREKNNQNISFIAIFCAINAIFVALGTYIPYMFFLMIFAVPLSTSIVYYICKKQFIFIYLLSSLIICSIISWGSGNVLFYVIPSMLSGLIFAVSSKKGLSLLWTITLATIVEMGFIYISIPLVRFLLKTDITKIYKSLFKLEDFLYFDYVKHAFIFVISLIQVTFSYFVLKEEMSKYQDDKNNENDFILISNIFNLISFCLGFLLILLKSNLSFICFFICLFFSCYHIIQILISKNIIIYLLLMVSIILSVIIFASLYNIIAQPFNSLTIGILYLFITLISFANKYLLKAKIKHTIDID